MRFKVVCALETSSQRLDVVAAALEIMVGFRRNGKVANWSFIQFSELVRFGDTSGILQDLLGHPW